MQPVDPMAAVRRNVAVGVNENTWIPFIACKYWLAERWWVLLYNENSVSKYMPETGRAERQGGHVARPPRAGERLASPRL